MPNKNNDRRRVRSNITEPKFNIFLSHKHRDAKFAMRLKEILSSPCGGLLDVHLLEGIASGRGWRSLIRDYLARSNMLLLLFTEPAADWDWCLYEAGMFAGLHGDSILKGEDEGFDTRVICMHNLSRDSDLPPQLHHLQRLPGGNLKRVVTFLRELYVETDRGWGFGRPLAPGLGENNERKLKAIATEIVNAWQEGTKGEIIDSISYGNVIEIDIKDAGLIFDQGGIARIPSDAIVDGQGMTLFELAGPHCPWRDVEAAASHSGDSRWTTELAESIFAACQGRVPRPCRSVYHPRHSLRMGYLPFLYRTDKRRDGSVACFVLFQEVPFGELKNLAEAKTPKISGMEEHASKVPGSDQVPIPKVDASEEVRITKNSRSPYLFVSYAHEDSDFVGEFHKRLKQRGIQHFVDFREVGWGDEIEKAILRGIRRATHCVPIISGASVRSVWVMYEFALARIRNLRIVPYLRHPDLRLPEFVRPRRHLTCRKDEEEFLDSLTVASLSGSAASV